LLRAAGRYQKVKTSADPERDVMFPKNAKNG